MKQDSPEAKNLQKLLKKLDRQYKPDDPPASDPVRQLVIGMLQWEATRKQAEQAFSKLMNELVDINEIRVSHDTELVAILGQNYPRVDERVARLREALDAIFVREHGVAMTSIANKSKKEQRAYVDSLPGMPPYVAAQVTLLSFGGHALPVDPKLIQLLADESILDPAIDPIHAENTLLKQIKAADAVHAHMLLQAWADDHRGGRSTKRSTKKKKAAPKKKTSARTTKTTAARTKRSTKKTTASKKKTASRTRRK
jgi:endonuclease III